MPPGIFGAAAGGIVPCDSAMAWRPTSVPGNVLHGGRGRFVPQLVVEPGHALAGHGEGLFVGIRLAFDMLRQLGEDVDAVHSGCGLGGRCQGRRDRAAESEAAAYRWNNLLQQDVIGMPEIGVEANMR